MFQAKDFYELTGLNRSTVRYYQREGLLTPSQVGENGYTYYDDHSLVTAMLIRNYRCVDFSMRDMAEQEKLSLEGQISHLQALRLDYQKALAQLERKIQSVDAYVQAMKQYRVLGQIFDGTPGVQLGSFYIKESLRRAPTMAKQEIAHCINSFPFVHITGKGSLEELSTQGVVHLELGYEYNSSRDLFQPLHAELYQHNITTASSMVIRLRVKDPLVLTAEDLAPLTKELEVRRIPLNIPIFDIISAVDIKGGERLYYISVRVLTE